MASAHARCARARAPVTDEMFSLLRAKVHEISDFRELSPLGAGFLKKIMKEIHSSMVIYDRGVCARARPVTDEIFSLLRAKAHEISDFCEFLPLGAGFH